jgi:hypothetical protein
METPCLRPKPLKQHPKDKPERLRRKIYMTIAAGFQCTDGIVLCADTQETHRQILKVRIAKITRKPEIDYPGCDRKVLFSGAGDGAFIDKLIHRAWKAAQQADADIDSVALAIEDSIKATHQEYGQIYQPGYLPEVQLIYGLWVRGYPTRLFSSVQATVNPVESHECVGIGEVLARYIADRMFVQSTMPIRTAKILSIYLLEAAKEYVDGCGGGSVIEALHADGTTSSVDGDTLLWTSIYLRQLEAQMSAVMLRAPDSEMSDQQFDDAIDSLMQTVITVRQSQLQMRQSISGTTPASKKSEPEP